MITTCKPLGRKAYGSIGHLPSSRLGPGDHKVTDGQARICTEKARDSRDKIIVQEKLDGSCVAVALIDGILLPLVRSGYPAVSSKYEQHHLFHDWVFANESSFRDCLKDGERIVGEWLAQAHGTIYNLGYYSSRILPPFVAFDLMIGSVRMPFCDFKDRIGSRFYIPQVLGEGPMTIERMKLVLGEKGYHGAEAAEGAVWRVERDGKVDFLAKWVKPDKIDGKYLPEVSKQSAVWNWRP